MKSLPTAALSLVIIVTTIQVCDLTGVDTAIQFYFYDVDAEHWLLQKHNTALDLIFYRGPKILIGCCALSILLLLTRRKSTQWVKTHRTELAIALLLLVVTPVLVAILKYATNIACPSQLTVFGGSLPAMHLLDWQRWVATPLGLHKCFPASHASTGFALIGLCLLVDSKRKRIAICGTALLLGWAMGLYKVAIGDHFFSHTLVSMEIVLALFVLLHNRYCPAKPVLDPGNVDAIYSAIPQQADC